LRYFPEAAASFYACKENGSALVFSGQRFKKRLKKTWTCTATP
jgi:hypothetical protein